MAFKNMKYKKMQCDVHDPYHVSDIKHIHIRHYELC